MSLVPVRAAAGWRVALLLAAAAPFCGLHAEDQGAALFLEGRNAVARLAGGQVEVSAERFPCARCHGRDGLGSREGGTVMPPVTWSRLSAATVKRPAYDRAAIVEAVEDGVGASGRPLSTLMPRYSASPGTLAALTRYLEALDVLQTAGISSSSIAVEAPSDGQRRKGFEAAIGSFNRQGGAYGRTVSVSPPGDTLVRADDVLDTLRDRLEQTIRRALLGAIREDGWTTVAIPGAEASPALLYEMNRSGLELVPGAPAVLWFSTADTEDLRSRSVYSPFAVAGPMLRELTATGAAINLVGVGKAAVAWALHNEGNAEAVDGYLTGLLLQDALLASGRALTRAGLERQLDLLDLDARAFVTRSR